MSLDDGAKNEADLFAKLSATEDMHEDLRLYGKTAAAVQGQVGWHTVPAGHFVSY